MSKPTTPLWEALPTDAVQTIIIALERSVLFGDDHAWDALVMLTALGDGRRLGVTCD